MALVRQPLPCRTLPGPLLSGKFRVPQASMGGAKKSGADPLICAAPSGPAAQAKDQAPANLTKPARGPAADHGACPTRRTAWR
jgi:hypothetical protein